MPKAMLPNLHEINYIGLSISVSTASVERSFFQIKMIKTHLCKFLNFSECSLSQLMRITTEATEVLSEKDFEKICGHKQRKT